MKYFLFSVLSITFFECSGNKICPDCPTDDITPTGKRNYVWSIDSVDYGNLPSRIELESIWGSSAADVWGAAGDAPDVRDCLWHYDGTKWNRATEGTPITEFTGNKTVYAVWGSANNNVWAFGRKISQNALSAFIMHYDGSKWTDATPSNVQAITGHLYNVYGVSQNNIWVGGYEYVLHFDGSQWTPYKVADSIIVGSITGNGENVYLHTYSPWGTKIVRIFRFANGVITLADYTTVENAKFGGLILAVQNKLISFTNGTIVTNLKPNGEIDTLDWHRELTTTTSFVERFVESSKNVFVVGQWNLIYHYNGTDWKQIFIDVPNHAVDPFALFWGVWTNSDEVFICDTENGIIYHGR